VNDTNAPRYDTRHISPLTVHASRHTVSTMSDRKIATLIPAPGHVARGAVLVMLAPPEVSAGQEPAADVDGRSEAR
jgi:hypothetical protein